jgi:DNA-binding IclR family transcriptional regulator
MIAPQRGVRLLQLFSESPGGLTAKEVAAISRLAVSTVHHFLANLVTTGFLNREVEGTHYPSFSVGITQTLAVYTVYDLHAPRRNALSHLRV